MRPENVADGVPDSSIPECKWIVLEKTDPGLGGWSKVWAEGVELFNL